jgi:hypothetical protein
MKGAPILGAPWLVRLYNKTTGVWGNHRETTVEALHGFNKTTKCPGGCRTVLLVGRTTSAERTSEGETNNLPKRQSTVQQSLTQQSLVASGLTPNGLSRRVASGHQSLPVLTYPPHPFFVLSLFLS